MTARARISAVRSAITWFRIHAPVSLVVWGNRRLRCVTSRQGGLLPGSNAGLLLDGVAAGKRRGLDARATAGETPALLSDHGADERLEDAVAVGAAEFGFGGALRVGHHAEDVAAFATDARDVLGRAIR